MNYFLVSHRYFDSLGRILGDRNTKAEHCGISCTSNPHQLGHVSDDSSDQNLQILSPANAGREFYRQTELAILRLAKDPLQMKLTSHG